VAAFGNDGRMKWLTREWYDRGFSDPQSLAAWDAYGHHLSEILGELNDGVDVLISDLHIHGAVVDKYEYNNGVLLLVMLTGNDSSGYTWATLTYQGVTELEPEARLFDFLIQKPTELLHDEIDVIDGMYEHRVLCWPDGELRVRFRTLHSELSPGTREERATFD
jgi:hypothetical protein